MTEHNEFEGWSISHLVHVLKEYRVVILGGTALLVFTFMATAIGYYLFGSGQRLTTQQFRLDFRGAKSGEYPNGDKFSAADIVAPSILLEVYNANALGQFVSFDQFSSSIFILENNQAYAELIANYQSRLADPKLLPLDRERIQSEFELKRASMNRSEYSINYLRPEKTYRIPENVIRKVLGQILDFWARRATIERHVLEYPISIVSPDLVVHSLPKGEPIITAHVLGSKIRRALKNVRELIAAPGGNLMRSSTDKMTLREIETRLTELELLQLEPLAADIISSGMMARPAATLRFLETQRAYNQRIVENLRREAETIRNSLAIYEREGQEQGSPQPQPATTQRTQSSGGNAETVMPQFSDSFLDRLVTVLKKGDDVEYRQRLVEDYQRVSKEAIPAESSVAYIDQLIARIRAGSAQGTTDPTEAIAAIDSMRDELKRLIVNFNELHLAISRNLNPSTQLFTLTAPPGTSVLRPISVVRLALYGALLLLLAIPALIVGCIIHARVGEEEEEEAYVTSHGADAAAT